MGPVLLDTHTLAWAIEDRRRLPGRVAEAIDGNFPVLLSSVTFYEIGLKVRLGRWPEMANYVDGLSDLVSGLGIQVIAVEADIALAASLLDWNHRDPFDRIIGATALLHEVTLLSTDTKFDALPGLRRLW